MSDKRTKTMPNDEMGFMGLEGMGSLLFYLIMLSGATTLIVQLFAGNDRAKVEQCLTSMRMGIQMLYSGQGGYGTYTSDAWKTMSKTVAAAGILPKGFEYTTFTSGFGSTQAGIKSPWNTSIRVTPWKDGKRFAIKIYVPEDECVRLATYDMKGWDEVQMGFGNTTKPIYSVEDAPSLCKHDENTLIVFIAR